MSLKVERGRTLARSQALQLLFQAEIRHLSVDDVLAGDYLISKGPLAPYAAELARGCYAHVDEIDRGLRRVSENWALERMPGSDRNLLRLAVYELRFAPDHVDDAVVINEAVEIAKAYGTDESASFVNGVLGRVVRDGRIFPKRAAAPADDAAEGGNEAAAGVDVDEPAADAVPAPASVASADDAAASVSAADTSAAAAPVPAAAGEGTL